MTKKLKPLHPEHIIVGTDPVAISILKQIYSGLKDRTPDSLDFFEMCIVNIVEKTYSNQVKLKKELFDKLLTQVREILNDATNWDKRKEEFYSAIEKIMFLKSREDVFKDFFESVEETVAASMQLDFSKRVPLMNLVSSDKRNVLNYASLMLNTLVETMGQSIISMKATNSILDSVPGIVAIVTDRAGNIRFISSLGEKQLRVAHNSLLGESIAGVIKNYPAIKRTLEQVAEIGKLSYKLVLNDPDSTSVEATITIPPIHRNYKEIEEIIYTFPLYTL